MGLRHKTGRITVLFLLLLSLLSQAEASDYAALKARAVQQKEALQAQWKAAPSAERPAIIRQARAHLERLIREELVPAWYGTGWEFYSSAEQPGPDGLIACGYFVGTVLRDAGFEVDRIALGDQASEYIIRTFAPASLVRSYGSASPETIVAAVRSSGPGIYIVGLDYHVAFLINDGSKVNMCHSSPWLPGEVLCEPAAQAEGLQSHIHVLGPLLTDRAVTAWLNGETISIYRPPRR